MRMLTAAELRGLFSSLYRKELDRLRGVYTFREMRYGGTGISKVLFLTVCSYMCN